MVSGKSIDEEQVQALVEQTDLIFAHNAYFDRVMVEKHWPCFSEKPWSCTFQSVDWLREGFTAGKLTTSECSSAGFTTAIQLWQTARPALHLRKLYQSQIGRCWKSCEKVL